MPTSKGKTDRRVMRTRKAILGAFNRLLAEKGDLSKVTVSGLAKEADIDRKTFYLHYSSIDDLLDDVADSIVVDAMDTLEADMQRRMAAASVCLHFGSTYVQKVDPDPKVLFKCVDELLESISSEHSVLNIQTLEVIFERLAKPLEREIIQRRLLDDCIPNKEHLEYYVSFFLGGTLSLYRSWIKNGRKEPISKVSDIAASLMSGVVDRFHGDGKRPQPSGQASGTAAPMKPAMATGMVG